MTAPMSNALFSDDRDLAQAHGARYVCGADEVGHGAWAGPLVVAAVRFDYHQLDADPGALERLARLKDSKDFKKPHQRAALLPVIMEVADMVSVVASHPPRSTATGCACRLCARLAARFAPSPPATR